MNGSLYRLLTSVCKITLFFCRVVFFTQEYAKQIYVCPLIYTISRKILLCKTLLNQKELPADTF